MGASNNSRSRVDFRVTDPIRLVEGPARRLAAVAMTACLPLAAEYPHAFPRKGVRLLFDNPRLSIWEVHWLQGVHQPVHRHLYDWAFICATGKSPFTALTERCLGLVTK
jgi:hypothetical protein